MVQKKVEILIQNHNAFVECFPPKWKNTWVLPWYENAAMILSCHRVSTIRFPSLGVAGGGRRWGGEGLGERASRASMSGKPECWGGPAWVSHFPYGSLLCCWRVLQKRHDYLFLITIFFSYFLPFADENNGFILLNYLWKKILPWYQRIDY